MRAYVYDTARQIDLAKSKQIELRWSQIIRNDNCQEHCGQGDTGTWRVRICRGVYCRASVEGRQIMEIGGGTLEGHQKNITRETSR